MTVQPLTARPQKDIVLAIAQDEYQRQVSNVTLTPNVQTSTTTWQGGTPDAKLTETDTTITWTLSVTAIQQLDDAQSYCRWALAHAGETATARWKPHADSDFEQEVDFTVVPPALGGPVNKRNESTMNNPVDGEPRTPTA